MQEDQKTGLLMAMTVTVAVRVTTMYHSLYKPFTSILLLYILIHLNKLVVLVTRMTTVEAAAVAATTPSPCLM